MHVLVCGYFMYLLHYGRNIIEKKAVIAARNNVQGARNGPSVEIEGT